MKEIIWLGRGGQGAFTVAKLLGAAYTLKGDQYYGIAFPSFGPERRGAPVNAFTKVDNKPVLDRSQTKKADYIIVLDETLYDESLKLRLKENGKIIVNTKVLIDEKVISFDAQQVAKQFKLSTVNTVLLGAFAAISGIVTLEELFSAIEYYMPQKIREKNKEAVAKAQEEVSL
ncbi:MAG: ketoisovalerate oxidoreductase [Cellulosilyticum sp.]|nr:ketoisovalerate oxidoreductase [Cellulosilyticum sp.]